VIVTADAEFCTVQLTEFDPIPEPFVARITRLWAPGDSPDADQGDVQGDAGAPSRLHVTVAAGSDTVNEADANVAVVGDAGPPVTATTGATGAGATTVQLHEAAPCAVRDAGERFSSSPRMPWPRPSCNGWPTPAGPAPRCWR
jgi:hypothetical protein